MRWREEVRGNLLLATTYRKRRGEKEEKTLFVAICMRDTKSCTRGIFTKPLINAKFILKFLLQIGKFCTCTCFPGLKHLASAAETSLIFPFSLCDKRCCDIFIHFRNILQRRFSRTDGKTLSLESNGNGNWRGGGGYRFDAAAAPPPFFPTSAGHCQQSGGQHEIDSPKKILLRNNAGKYLNVYSSLLFFEKMFQSIGKLTKSLLNLLPYKCWYPLNELPSAGPVVSTPTITLLFSFPLCRCKEYFLFRVLALNGAVIPFPPLSGRDRYFMG